MKKIFKISFTLIILLLSINIVNASTEKYDRKVESNYGVKKFEVNSSNRENVLNTPYVNEDEKIYDFADILTIPEEERIYKLIEEFIDKYDTELIIVTINMPYYDDTANEDFAADFYDYNDFGIDYEKYDGIVLLRNAYINDPYFDMYTFGNAQLYFSQERFDTILDSIYYNISNKRYYDGFTDFIFMVNYYYEEGIDPFYKHYYVDDNGFLQKKYVFPYFTCIFGSAIITFVVMSGLIKKNKMVRKAYDAKEYMDKNSIVYRRYKDIHISTHTNKVYIPPSTSSYSGGSRGGRGGGGSSHRGSSGGGHSRGGGRHG